MTLLGRNTSYKHKKKNRCKCILTVIHKKLHNNLDYIPIIIQTIDIRKFAAIVRRLMETTMYKPVVKKIELCRFQVTIDFH